MKKIFIVLILTTLYVVFLTDFLEAKLNLIDKTILSPEPNIGRLDPVVSNFVIIRLKPNVSLNEIENLPIQGKIVHRLLEPDNSYSNNSILSNKIKSKKNVNLSVLKKSEEPLFRTFYYEYTGYDIPEVICNKLKNNSSIIEIAEPFYVQSLTGEFIPNDSLVPDQKMLNTIKAFEAWDIFKGDYNVVVGISDSGVLQDHEDLVNSLWYNINEIPDNLIDDDNNGYIDDYRGVNLSYMDDTTAPGNTFCLTEGHGTGTAGISSATCNNKIGVAGVGYNSKMFPIKTMRNYYPGIVYGYESIIYAAKMGFDVLNCSWGGFSYSEVSQSIIDYAVNAGVAIVTGAGNHGTDAKFYPAGYFAVLGVGVTNPRDTVEGMSSYGQHVGIMAPGQETLTTSNAGGYGGFCCTSGASPIVAGAVAIVRAKHPELTAIQALEFTRQCTDNIEELNPDKKGVIPGRLNLLKCVTEDPWAKPSIKLNKFSYNKSVYLDRTRLVEGDTIFLNISAINFLANANNVTFKLNIAKDPITSVELLDSLYSIDLVKTGDTLNINNFKIRIKQQYSGLVLLRVDIEDNNGYKDCFWLSVVPTNDYNVFSNNLISITAADNGRVGFSDPPYDTRGKGFVYKPYYNLLFESGLIVVENSSKVVSQVRNPGDQWDNYFTTIKNYAFPDEHIGTITDIYSPDSVKIGLEIKKIITLPYINKPCTRIRIYSKNVSDNTLNNLSLGYFFDWDIGASGDSNYVNLYQEAIPESKKGIKSAALYAHRNGDYPYLGCLVISDEVGAEAQLPAFDNAVTWATSNNFGNSDKIALLNSGITQQTDIVGDIAIIAGMKYNGILLPSEEKKFDLCLCASKSLDELKANLIGMADSTLMSKSENQESKNMFLISPNPSDKVIKIDCIITDSDYYNISILDIQGNIIENIFSGYLNDGNYQFISNTEKYSSGIYFCRIKTNKEEQVIKFLISK